MLFDILYFKTYNKNNWKPELLDEYWSSNRKNLMIHPKTLEFLELTIWKLL